MTGVCGRSMLWFRLSIYKRLVLVVLALVLVETAARVVCVVAPGTRAAPSSASVWYQLSPDSGWEWRPGFSGDILGARRSIDHDGYFVEDGQQLQRGARPLILVLGDSCSFGFRIPFEQTYGEVIEELIPACAVVNLSVVGYSSCQGLAALRRRLDRLKPDLLLVSFSWNDRRYVTSSRDVDGPKRFARAWRAHVLRQRLLSISCAARLLDGLISPADRNGEGTDLNKSLRLDPSRPHGISTDMLCPRVPPVQYRENLKSIAQMANSRGVPLIFVALADNPAVAGTLDRGIRLIAEEQYEAAIALLRQGAKTEGWYTALAAKYLADAYAREGRIGEAAGAKQLKKVYGSLLGGTLCETDWEYRAIMKSVAQESGCRLCDAAAVLAAHPEYFLDECHFGVQAHREIANLLRGPIQEALRRRPRRE